MQLGRTFRTVRHLTAEQWVYRAVCRGRWVLAEHAPERFGRRIERTAESLDRPRPDHEGALRVARTVLMLQQAVHGTHLDGVPAGRFHFLGRGVDFGAPGAIGWRRELGEGNNRLWRMTLSYMGWAVPLLARGEPAMLAAVLAALDSLERQNSWSEAGVFRDVWHPYSASHRLINLLAGLALFRAAGGQPAPADEARVLDHVRRCAAFLLHNLERDLQYNHLLKNIVALATFAASLARPSPRFAFLARAMQRSIDQQVLADGGHAERSPMYHALCLVDLTLLRDSGLFPDQQDFLDAQIAAMRRALGALSHPDGDIALFNDAWLGEAPRAVDLAPPAPDGTCSLPEMGYVRLGGGGDAVLFDCGPCGPDANPGHAHADFLSVELSIAGSRFLVDTGVPTYSAGALRDACRSAARHNGPHLAGAEPIEFWHSFRVGRRGRAARLEAPGLAGIAPLWCAGWQDGYRRQGVTPARWVGLWPQSGLLLVDVWQGAAPGRPALRFTVPGSWRSEAGHAFAQAGRQVAFELVAGKGATVEPTCWWPRFGEEEPAHAVAVEPEAIAGGAFAATLWRWGASPPVSRADAEHVARTLLNQLSDSIRRNARS